MKKHAKYIVPFVIMFFFLPMINSIAIGTYTYGPPTKNWGIDIGDEHFFTTGWAFELDLGDKAWDMFDTYLDYIDPALDGRTLYNTLMNIESVYNFRITITNLTSAFYNSTPSYNYTNDVISGDMAWKAASMTEYGPLNATMIYEIQQNAMLFNAYSTLFGWGLSSSDLIGELAMYGPEMDEYYQSWDTDNSGEPRNQPGSPPIFIPQDWSLEDFYNEMRGKLNATHYEFFTNETGVTITNWNDLTAALGFTSIRIDKRDAVAKFKLSSMDETFLDLWVNNTGFFDPVANASVETYDAFLDWLNITNFDAEARFSVEWNRKGILTNFHVQGEVTGEYEGEKFKFAPQFDISYGEHDKINAKFTIPGYPILLVLFVGTISVSVLIYGIKKKKS